MKRLTDVVASVVGLILLAPLFVVIAVWVKHDSAGPVFFRQERVGRGGRTFRMFKFRSMRAADDSGGPLITVAGDSRVTKSGSVLRRFKLDELPQLIDVLLGHMSLVGPRPEVPKYVAYYPSDVRDLVLSVRPGMTDPASLEFRNEGELLATADDPEALYIDAILPRKLALYTAYLRHRSWIGDLRIIGRTVAALRG